MVAWSRRPRNGIFVHIILLIMQDVCSQVSSANGLIPLPLAVLKTPWPYMSRCILHSMLQMPMTPELGLTEGVLSLCMSAPAARWLASRVHACSSSLLCMMHAHQEVRDIYNHWSESYQPWLYTSQCQGLVCWEQDTLLLFFIFYHAALDYKCTLHGCPEFLISRRLERTIKVIILGLAELPIIQQP